MNYIRAGFIWFFQVIVQLIGILLGFVIVPLALLKPDDSQKEATYQTDGKNEWWFRQLPSWAKWWNNSVDGLLGDTSYRWAGRDIPFGMKNTSFMGQFWWTAVRNPFNYFKRFILSCDVRKNEVVKLHGQDYVRDDFNNTGTQFLKCGHFYMFYGVWRYGKSNRALVMQLGNKLKVKDNTTVYTKEQEYKYLAGFTFEINPFKDIS
jgi:hypothetical protein